MKTDSVPASAPHVALLPLGIFTLLYLLPALAGAVLTGNAEFLFYIAVMLVLVGIVMAVHRKVGFTAPLLWALNVWGMLHMAGGLVPVPESWPINGTIRVLYSWWIVPERLKYDQVVHAYGFGTTTWACWQALAAALATRTGQPRGRIVPTGGLLTLCALGAMGCGALNEVVEFAATLMTDTNVGGYVNTGWDLVSNMTGAVLAAVMLWLAGTRAL